MEVVVGSGGVLPALVEPSIVIALEEANLAPGGNKLIVALDLSGGLVKELPANFMVHSGALVFVKFPATLESIGARAFMWCESLVLVSLRFCIGLEEIEDNAFAYCVGLHEFEIPPSVNRIGLGAVQLSAIVDLDFGHVREGLVIGARALEGCSRLVSLVLPAGAVAEAGSLSGLKSLKHLRLQTLEGIDETALDGTHLGDIELGGIDSLNKLLEGILTPRSASVQSVTVGVREGILVRLAPTSFICGPMTVVVEAEDEVKFEFSGGVEIPAAEPLDLAVMGELPESLPTCIRILDLVGAEVTVLKSVQDLPFLRRLVFPASLERIAEEGIAGCPRLEDIVVGNAPLREIEQCAMADDWSLERFRLPCALEVVAGSVFFGTSIACLDASECGSLREIAVSSTPVFEDLDLPPSFAGVLRVWYTVRFKQATFGAIDADVARSGLVFDLVRFAALKQPRGDFVPKMFSGALVFSEAAQLLGREAAAARPP
jgi:hypothetical protein